MTDNHRSPTVRHRRLTALLRRMREDAGLTRDEATRRLEFNASKLSKIETGNWKQLQPREVRAIVELYGVTDEDEQEKYIQLARDARKRGWWAPYSDMVGTYIGLEDEASHIKTFEPTSIPGLLQTEAYARALIRANPAVEGDEIERRVELRMERQKLLRGSHVPELWAIIDEAAMHRSVGDGAVMREQLEYLADLGSKRLTIQIVPFDVGAHGGMDGSFVMLYFPNPADQPVVHLEHATDGLYLESDDAIERYRVMFNHLCAVAVGPDASAELMLDAAAKL